MTSLPNEKVIISFRYRLVLLPHTHTYIIAKKLQLITLATIFVASSLPLLLLSIERMSEDSLPSPLSAPRQVPSATLGQLGSAPRRTRARARIPIPILWDSASSSSLLLSHFAVRRQTHLESANCGQIVLHYLFAIGHMCWFWWCCWSLAHQLSTACHFCMQSNYFDNCWIIRLLIIKRLTLEWEKEIERERGKTVARTIAARPFN